METTVVTTAGVLFPLLAAPESYQAGEWDLAQYPQKLAYWLKLFRAHFPQLLDAAGQEMAERGCSTDEIAVRLKDAEQRFSAYLQEIERAPGQFGRLDIMAINVQREAVLHAAGLVDPYRLIKDRENVAALALLPDVLDEIDALPEDQRVPRLIRGVLAGNIFDLGATRTAELFRGKSCSFTQSLQQLKPRPWAVDDLPWWCQRMLTGRPHRRAILFVDNAGPDLILGMIPLARDLVRRGTEVILTANTRPALNDITHAELLPLLEKIAGFDSVIAQALRNDRLRAIASGNGCALIDLQRVSPELVAAAAEADLVILEGMGRAVETNWSARFTCDVLKLAMIKTGGVAEHFGWQLFDLVVRFEPAR